MKNLYLFLLFILIVSCSKTNQNQDRISQLEQEFGLSSISPAGDGTLFFENISYGNDTRNQLDIILPSDQTPKGVLIFFHGGAFVAGDKSDVFDQLFLPTINELLANNIAVVSANYTFISSTNSQGVISALEDGSEVISFVENHLELMQIPANKIILGGVSAGAGIAQWNGYRDANNRQVQGILALAAQSTYNLYEWENVFPGFQLDDLLLLSPVLSELFFQFYKTANPTESELAAVNYIEFMDGQDPPVYVYNQAGDELITSGGGIDFDVLYHSYLHANHLRGRAIEVGQEFSGAFQELPASFVLRLLK